MAESNRPARFFFTGTDTEVGKTYVAALAAAELRLGGRNVAVYKPVASGCSEENGRRISGDAVALWEASGRRGDLDAVCPQRFLAPLSPPAAAAAEGAAVDEALLVDGLQAVGQGADAAVIEGAGGLLSPLSENWLNSDLAAKLSAPLVIVGANRLGAIHQVLATVLAARAIGLPILGIVLNSLQEHPDGSVAGNAEAIRHFTKVPILAELGYRATATGVDWMSLTPLTNQASGYAQAWL